MQVSTLIKAGRATTAAFASFALAILMLFMLSLLGDLGVVRTLDPKRISSDGGHAFSTSIVHRLIASADDVPSGFRRAAILTENASPLGPARQLHEKIRVSGEGRFALDNGVLRFSTSDHTDPRTNGRRYSIEASVVPSLGGYVLTALVTVTLMWLVIWSPTRRMLSERSIRYVMPAGALAIFGALLFLLHQRASIVLWPSIGGIVTLIVVAAMPILPWSVIWRRLLNVDVLKIARWSTGGFASQMQFPAPILLLLVSVLWAGTLWTAGSINPNYNDTLSPSLWRLGEITTYPGTIQNEVYPHLQVLLPRIIALLNEASGITPEIAHYGLAAFFVVLFIYVCGAAAQRLAGATGFAGFLVGCLAIASFVQGWLPKMHVGYPVYFHLPILLLGAWGAAAAIGVWVFWLIGGGGIASTILAFGLAGLVFDLHSTYGVIILGVLLTGSALDGLRSGAIIIAGRQMALGVLVFAAAAAPQIYFLIGHAPVIAIQAGATGEVWWTLMAFRKPFHIFLWGENGIVEPLIWLAGYWIAATVALWQRIPRDKAWRLVATGLAVAVFCIIAYGAYALRPTPLLVGLVLPRAALIPIFGIAVLVTSLVVLNFRAWCLTGSAVDAMRLAFSSLGLAVVAAPNADPWVRGLGLVALVMVKAIEWPMRSVRLKPDVQKATISIGAIASVVAVALPLLLVPAKWREALALMPARDTPEWSEVTAFLRKHAAGQGMTLMPPYPYAAVSSLQANPVDYGQMGYSVYAQWVVPFELKQISLLYGVDLSQHTPASIVAWLVERGGLTCVVERAYAAIVSDPSRLDQLRGQYPAMRFVVAPRPGTTPQGWTCGPANTAPLAFPVVFENDAYVIYDTAPAS